MAKKKMSKYDKYWEKKYGHLTNHTMWDPKGRKCEKCLIDNKPAPLGVDLTNGQIFCPICFESKGVYENGDNLNFHR